MADTIGRVETQFFTFGSADDPFVLLDGFAFDEVTVAYETYGTLNTHNSNAILVFHALTGSHHAAGYNPHIPEVGDRWTEEVHAGWWEGFIGPGKALDTDRFFVICANYLGGCYGSTGPASINPATGDPYGGSFPFLSFADMVDTQMRLLDHLGIEKLHATTGGSTGGVMALSLATRYPDRVDIVIPVAAGVRTTALQTISNFEQINAIQNDGHFASGDYYAGPGPEGGLALARMIGHKYFVSLAALAQRVRDEVISEEGSAGMYRLNSQLESYMRHQGDKFVMRFDANTYLRVMHAWNTYDLVREAGRDDFHDLFVNSKRHRYLVFSIDSDVCFYSEEQEELVEHLDLAGVPNRWVTVHSDKGHDAFLLEPQLFYSSLVDTLTSDG